MNPTGFPRRCTARQLASLTVVVAMCAVLGACGIGSLVGGMAESARLQGDHEVVRQYAGIEGHSYAVVVAADRLLQASYPGLTGRITERLNIGLANQAGASGFIPSKDLLRVLYNTPQWPAMSPRDLADMLGVERLIYVELLEYRLNETGNKYIWDGVASGVVRVYESDSGIPDDPMFEQAIRVGFPDGTGYTPAELPRAAVHTELSERFYKRVAWLFFDHTEPNAIKF